MTGNQEDTNHEHDQDCLNVVRTKCYYEILKVEKSASQDDIRRAYKKLAIKYHPDKNKSKHAAEAFKKVSHSFTTLSNEEKRTFYDKYGPEEEVRDRMHQQQAYFNQNEQDPFDLFNMFFAGNGNFEFHQGGNVFRRRQRQANHQPQQGYTLLLYQLLPFLLFIMMYILPVIFKSVR